LTSSSQRHHQQDNDAEFFIEWQPLPLDSSNDDDNNNDELTQARTMFQSPTTPSTLEVSKTSTNAAVTIRLPDHVQEALRQHAPLELICVDADASSLSSSGFAKQRDLTTPDHLNRGNDMTALPILCVYTSKDVFLLELAIPGSTSTDPLLNSYHTPSFTSPPPAGGIGKVLLVTEPFESQLLDASHSTRIVRIRPAPQFRMGYETLCRARAMAMLTYDRESNNYTLTLFHGESSSRRPSTTQPPISSLFSTPFVTQPLTFGSEYLVDDQDLITDFCFGQSEGLSLFSSLSVLFLQESGNILCASPVLFDGTVVSSESVQTCLEYLQDLQSSLSYTSAKWRQCKAAKAYFLDVFGEEMAKTKNTYLTARVQAVLHRAESAVDWPLAIQGPILLIDDAIDLPAAVSLEPFFCPTLVGVAMGRVGQGVDLAIVSPSGLIPRFALEGTDRFQLNDGLQQLGVVVDRIVVDADPETSGDQGTETHYDIPTLLPDPVVNTILHSASLAGVITISTNAMHVASQEICMEKENDPHMTAPSHHMEKRTTAWSSLNVTTVLQGNYLQGVVVTRDSQLGHVMIARLSNGTKFMALDDYDFLVP
jgi:predicted DNA binding CopG/RHH family protein